MFITGHSVDIYDPEVIAASMGSFFALTVVRFDSGEKLDKFFDKVRNECGDIHIIGTTAHQKSPVYEIDLTGGLVLLIGNETKGLSHAYYQWCDILCTIPMAETSTASSLNVGCAASILMYEVARQRSQK